MTNHRSHWQACCLAWIGLLFVRAAVLAVGPEDAEEWDAKTPISVSITSPADNTYVPINHTQTLTATATDIDCYRVGTTWYDYGDDVTSGDQSTDFHVWWTATAGIMTDMYGTAATFLAPDYSAGNDVRDVVVSAHADDVNRGDDTYGDSTETSQQQNLTLKVWQVTVTVSQAGTKSVNNDADALPVTHGGTTHGWIIPGTPVGATGYAANTEIMGSIPEGPGVQTGFVWESFRKGIAKFRSGGVWTDLDNTPNWADDSPEDYYDVDSRHGGTDERQIFMQDAPIFHAGATNDAGIAAGWTDFSYQYDFKSRVMYGGIRISNEPEWETKFVLVVMGGVWHVVSHTP